MRTVENTQMHFGKIAIAQIEIDSKSRDDIPAVLKGLQHIYTNPPLREREFALLLEQVRPGVDLKVVSFSVYVACNIKPTLTRRADHSRMRRGVFPVRGLRVRRQGRHSVWGVFPTPVPDGRVPVADP